MERTKTVPGFWFWSFLTQGPYSSDNFVRDRFLSKNIFRRGRSPTFPAHCEKVACVSGARETYIGAQITKAQFSPRAIPPSLAPNTRAKGHVTYAVFNGQCSLKPRANRHNIGCYFLGPFAHPFACCCANFETGQTMNNKVGSCWPAMLRPFAQGLSSMLF